MRAAAPASLPSSTMSSRFLPAREKWMTPKYKSAFDTHRSSALRQSCAPHTRRPTRLSSARGCTRTRMHAGHPTTPAAPSPEDHLCCGHKRVQCLLLLLSSSYWMRITQYLFLFLRERNHLMPRQVIITNASL